MRHEIISVGPVPATSDGALAGFEAVCSCGYRLSNTVESNAAHEGREHVTYMNTRVVATMPRESSAETQRRALRSGRL